MDDIVREKVIPDFPDYIIRDNGTVYSIKKGIDLKPHANGDFLRVDLYKDKIKYGRQLHRLVAEAFVDNPHNYNSIKHIDENTHNNRASNLEYTQYSFVGSNLNRNWIGIKRGKVIPVRFISYETHDYIDFDTMLDACNYFNKNKSYVHDCLKNKSGEAVSLNGYFVRR